MKSVNLNINEYRVSRRPSEMVCYGLGSCIALFIHDPVKKIGAGAHILIAHPVSSNEHLSAEVALKNILNLLRIYGSTLLGLRATVIGGASLIGANSLNVGSKNLDIIKVLLEAYNLEINVECCGGQLCRSVRFNTYTGEVKVKENKYLIT